MPPVSTPVVGEGAAEPPGAGAVAPAVIARQGIYDASLRLVAYELLFRPNSAGGVQLSDADAATAQVLLTAFSDVGLDALVGPHRAFVNVPYAFLTDGYCATLPTDRVVLEILETVDVDEHVLDVAQRLVAQGHTLALDDFEFRPGLEPLVELAEIVKLDVLALGDEGVERHVELLRPFGVTLLAEKVEDGEQIKPLRAMGFKYFQGYALQRPTTVRAQKASEANRAVLVQILAELSEPDVSAQDLVDTVSRDPQVAYALLRILNSAHLSLANRVTSIHQALVLLGIDGLRNWTTMMVMSRLASGSEEAISNALIRAKMCELCAAPTGAKPAIAFTAGLLSTLPAALGRPMTEIVEQLGLGDELRSALVDLAGPVGEVLAWTLAYEARDQEELARRQAMPAIANAFIDAVKWSADLTTTLARAGD
jgi:EAL and modified HD-GYP domain-containing signal transduction protein